MRRTDPVLERIRIVSAVRNPGFALDACQQGSIGHASCCKDHVCRHHVVARVDAVESW